MRHLTRLIFVLAVMAALAAATETKTWSEDDYAAFDKGDLKKLSLASDGRLTLAPAFRELFDTASVYLWALVEDSNGNVYAGGGGPGGPGARVYQIAPNGHGKTLVEFDDLEVHALAIDKKDQVYAATSPDGKIYKISSGGKAEVFYDPHAKYVWAMAFDSHGDLFIATGDRGEIFRVAPDGKGRVFYRTDETHARSLTIDAKDNLIVGTEPGGLIVRVAPNGDGFVLYQAPKREITTVAVAKDGSIYAAGVGNKEGRTAAPTAGPPPSMPPPAPPQPANPATPAQQVAPSRPAAAGPPTLAPVAAIAGGSEVYRIDPEGFPHKVWSNAQAIVYTVGFDARQRPLIGTGNKGTLYRLDSDLVYTELLSAAPTQVTSISTALSGNLYAATGNVGKVYRIGPGLEKEGTLESDVFDAGLFSRWGRLSFRGQANGGQIAFETRSGNLDRPDKDWSAWSEAITSPDGGRVSSPPARFLQWKLMMKALSGGASPEVCEVNAAYLQRNVAPQVQQIEITPPNYRFPPPATLTITTPPPLSLPPLGKPARSTPSPSSGSDASSMQYAKGWIGARWAASDENGDSLIYTVQIKGQKESEWKLLKDKLADKHWSWDSTAFPDGEYRIRVIASDAPGNTAEQALTGELTSDPFLIDNTPPMISGLEAAAAGNKLTIRWKAVDALSVIDKAEVSVNGGEWTLVEPTTKLSDSLEENYDVALDRPSGGEQTIAVRVTDDYDNQVVAKVVVK